LGIVKATPLSGRGKSFKTKKGITGNKIGYTKKKSIAFIDRYRRYNYNKEKC